MASLPRRGSVADRAGRIALYMAIVLAPFAAALIARQTDYSLSLYSAGKAAALLGFSILAMQLVLAARIKWLERPFGLDRLYRWHRGMALVGGLLVLAHPVLLALGGSGARLFTNLGAPWYIWLGKVGLLLLLMMILAALGRKALRLDFEYWRLAHGLVAGVVVVGGMGHALNAGEDLKAQFVRVPFGIVAALGIFAVVYLYHSSRSYGDEPTHKVASVERETHNVWTVRLTPLIKRNAFDYLPGQFQFITLDRKRVLVKEEHPFTLSSDPSDGGLIASTIKESGDFTRTIGETPPGQRATVSGPYGRFSYVLHPDEADLVFIAGGIGITPLMSMLRHMRSTEADRNVLLLYGNRAEEDIVFRAELAALEAGETPCLRVIHVLSDAAESWGGETGYVDRDKIERLCGEVTGKAFYVCGPPPMMRLAIRALKGLGVASRRIHHEYFAL